MSVSRSPWRQGFTPGAQNAQRIAEVKAWVAADERKGAWRCYLCPETFGSEQSLMRHTRTVHARGAAQ